MLNGVICGRTTPKVGSKHTKDEFSKRKRGIRKGKSLRREKKIKKVTSSIGKIVIRKNKTRIN